MIDSTQFSLEEQKEILESYWYRAAQTFRDAKDPLERLDALENSDSVLDAYLDVVAKIGKVSATHFEGVRSHETN